jgi:chromosomal replication initiation ATPase DnaA
MQQTAFSFDIKDNYNPNEFIKSDSNVLACNMIDSWQPGTSGWGVRPYPKALMLRGPNSSGKTLLARKWAEKSGALFLNSFHQLTEKLVSKHQAFIIDGFDSNWDEEQTLHFFNIIHEHDKYLLITTVKIPQIKLPDLRSRIAAINVVDINPPDDDLVKMLIFKIFSNYSVVVSQEVINYMLKVLPRSFPAIISSVQKINAYALEHKHKITVPLVKNALST